MFESITKSFTNIVDKIRGKKFLTEQDVDSAIRDIRIALLEADVSFVVVRDFIKNLKEKIVGHKVIENVSQGDMIVKLVNDELINCFGEEQGDFNINVGVNTWLMIGLQGSGKTTTAVKLAHRFTTKFNKKVLLVSLDVYRPAAQQQLKIFADSVNIETLDIVKDEKPLEIVGRALKKADNYDIVIFDSAGRLFIDTEMMNELQQIKQLVKPSKTILVADSLTGQESVNIAKEFDDKITIDDIILTRIDGDGRGGAALSMKMITNKNIRYIGVGERVNDLELFHSKRVVSRILDKGDIVSFVEKAEEVVNKNEAEELERKVAKGQFDFDDFLKQLGTMKKLGGIGKILSFLPGASKLKELVGGFDNSIFKKQEAMILSMTKQERQKPQILNSSRKFRIAEGSGTKIQDVNSLIKRFKTIKSMAENIGGMDKNQIQNIMRNLGDLDFNNSSE